MKELSDYELMEAAGGIAKSGYTTVIVRIQWAGNALANINRVSELTVTMTDPEGTAAATLFAANNWSTSFRVQKGAEFHCWLDLRKYPFIKSCTDSWDQKTNIFVYRIS